MKFFVDYKRKQNALSLDLVKNVTKEIQKLLKELKNTRFGGKSVCIVSGMGCCFMECEYQLNDDPTPLTDNSLLEYVDNPTGYNSTLIATSDQFFILKNILYVVNIILTENLTSGMPYKIYHDRVEKR